jgi:phage/plasmid-associated DNA primase
MFRGRFVPPTSVRAAGAEYREAIDTAEGWLAERCGFCDPRTRAMRPDLYADYEKWCEESGHRYPLRAPALYDRFRARHDLEEITVRGIRGFRGIRLRGAGADVAEDDPF